MITIRDLLNGGYNTEVFNSNTMCNLHGLYCLLYNYREAQEGLIRIETIMSIEEISSSIYTLIDDYMWKRLKESIPYITPNVENKLRFSEAHMSMLADYVYRIVNRLLDNTKTPDSLLYGEGAWSLKGLIYLLEESMTEILKRVRRNRNNTSKKIVLKLKRNK